MQSELEQILNYVNGHRESRQKAADFLLENPVYFPDFISDAFGSMRPDSHKAFWIMEFIAHKNPDWFIPHLDFILENASHVKSESAIRPLSKIFQILVTGHYKKTVPEIQLNNKQLQKITEMDFDWLISNCKVATKAYSMRSLYLLGNEFQWIKTELLSIIQKDFAKESAAYKAAAREIIKKLS